jgi:HPt (histidine-containing phosphotransfer) domain-containing protein
MTYFITQAEVLRQLMQDTADIKQAIANLRAHLDQRQTAADQRQIATAAHITKGFSDMSGANQNLQNEIDQLVNGVSANTDASHSAEQMLDKIFAMLQAAQQSGGTPQQQLDQITAAINTLQQNTTELAQSVVTNTPADTGGGATQAPSGSGTG